MVNPGREWSISAKILSPPVRQSSLALTKQWLTNWQAFCQWWWVDSTTLITGMTASLWNNAFLNIYERGKHKMKFSTTLSILSTAMLTSLFMPLSQACEKGYEYDFNHMVTISKIVDKKRSDVESYRSSTGNCIRSKEQSHDLVSSSQHKPAKIRI